MNLVVNPGSGPIAGETSERDARANMRHFQADAGLVRAGVEREPARDRDGRFAFALSVPTPDGGSRRVAIDMPGLPLVEVRFLQTIPRPPPARLYVDGGSWWWPFALNIVTSIRDGES